MAMIPQDLLGSGEAYLRGFFWEASWVLHWFIVLAALHRIASHRADKNKLNYSKSLMRLIARKQGPVNVVKPLTAL